MAHKFASIAFTDSVRGVQKALGSRDAYVDMDGGEDRNSVLSEREVEFIQERDSFYMASVSETDWPYVQHRGGPKGFLKVLDHQTLGFADFSGNRQYISTGNFLKNDRVALILMDYPNRTRLKILGRVRSVTDDLTLLAGLEDPGYRARVERAFIIHIQAFDWNCPQHITPRYTDQDIERLLAPLRAENEKLKCGRPPKTADYPDTLGDGPLALEITGIRQLTPRVRAYQLRDRLRRDLPPVSAGAHIQIPVQLENGEQVLRHYSLCSDPKRRDSYEIAVLRKDKGAASQAIHRYFQLGQKLNCARPESYFSLHRDHCPAVLIAGGIGITPIKAIAQQLHDREVAFTLHYGGRELGDMAFHEDLRHQFGDRAKFYTSKTQRMDLAYLLEQAPTNSQFYVCGPESMLDDFLKKADAQKVDHSRLHFERFSVQPGGNNKPFTVTLAGSGQQVTVAKDETLLDALLNAGIAIPYSCKSGNCKSCTVHVLEGEVMHRDSCLNSQEKHKGLMCTCVSRAINGSMLLDI